MDRKDFILGGIALVAGILLGLLFAPRGASIEDIESAIEDRLAAVESAASGTGDSVAALHTHVDDRVTALQTQVEESVTSLKSEFSGLGERIGAVETSVKDTVSGQAALADRLSSELSGRLESIGSAISQQSDTLQSRLEGFRQSLTGGEQSGGGLASAPAALGGEQSGGGYGVGSTAALADGAIRAFVSRIDEDTDSVRLSIHGTTSVVAVGETVDVTVDGRNCEVTVVSVSDGMAALSGTCS